MRFFCPGCWSDFGADVKACPNCGLDIVEFWEDKDYVEKLIIALKHPEPETLIRAAWILGRLGDQRAVEPLIDLIDRTPDVYITAAAVKALVRFDNRRAQQFLQNVAVKHPATMVRKLAAVPITADYGRISESRL